MKARGLHFELREFAVLLGVDPGRVRGWVDRGVVRPAIKGKGPGRRRSFDFDNLVHGLLLLRLQNTFGERSRAWGPAFQEILQAATRFKAVESGAYVTDFLVLFQIGDFCIPPMVARDESDAEALTLKETISEIEDERELRYIKEISELRPGVWTKTIVSFRTLAREAEARIKEAGLG